MKKVIAFSGTASKISDDINRWQAQNRGNEVYEVNITGAAQSGTGNQYASSNEPTFVATITYEG